MENVRVVMTPRLAFSEEKAMTTNDSAEKKRTAIDHLNYGKMTAKRVSYESWEFTVTGPRRVRVTNASYGFLKDDHSYTVGVEERDGVAVPAECECPADKHREGYDCKHKVSLATVGGPTVLNAAIEYDSSAADKVRADGGVHAVDKCPPEDCACSNLSDFPCWPCVRRERKRISNKNY